MAETNKISIALCTYNGEKYLPEQLQSLAAQTRLPDELIVCDDCSTDNTIEIVRRFAQDAPFAVHLFINERNLRVIKNFEKAISLCGGDIIALSDQDDVWLPKKLELFEAEFLKDDSVGLVFCNGEIVDENLNSYHQTSWQVRGFGGKRFERFVSGDAFRTLRQSNFVSGCMAAFRARFRELIAPIPTELPELIHDYWIALLVTAVSRAAPVPAPLVKYRQHGGQQLGMAPAESAEEPNKTAAANERIPYQAVYADDIRRMKAVRERLRALSDKFPCRSVLSELNQYITHIEARTALQNKQAARLPTVFREFASLRYHRYSNGAASAIKDLIY